MSDVSDPGVEAMDTTADSSDDTKDNNNDEAEAGVDAGSNKDKPEASSGENGEGVGDGGASPPNNAEPDEVSDPQQVEPPPVPSYDVQKQEIHPLLTQRLKKGDKWYLVDQKWFKQWKKHTGFDSWDQHTAGEPASNPGPIDNSILFKDSSKDNLNDHLMEELDYALLPKPAWEKLVAWYGLANTSKPICRGVVEYGTYVKHLKVEVYLIDLKLTLHPHTNEIKIHSFSRADTIKTLHEKMIELFEISNDEETRLWQRYMTNSYELLTNQSQTVSDAGIYGGQMILLEKKNKDGQWSRTTPSMTTGTSSYNTRSSSSSQSSSYYSSSYSSSLGREPNSPGLCGLSNLGNTCFMNSALQCLGNTKPLVEYFIGKEGEGEKPYKKHINRNNPLGMGGVIAETYGALLDEMWSGHNSYLAPRQFKNIIGRHAPQFSGYSQHDSHELLAFLLDGLHEDLNLIKKKPYVDMDIKTEGRDDNDIARETWLKYLQRNQSVIVRLFQGQLKSTLHCPKCDKESRIFDPFMYLSLPLPVLNTRDIEVFFVRSDSSASMIKYHLSVPKNGSVIQMKEKMQEVTGIDPSNLVVIDVYHSRFHRVYYDKDPISHIMDRDEIFIYELCKPLGDQEWVPVPVYMREIKHHSSTTYFGQKHVTSCGQVFGLPVIVTVPRKGCTYRTLYETISSQISRVVLKPQKKKTEEEVVGEGENVTAEESKSVDSEMKETQEGTVQDEEDEATTSMEVETTTEPEPQPQTEDENKSETNGQTESSTETSTETITEGGAGNGSGTDEGEKATERSEEAMDTEGNDQDDEGEAKVESGNTEEMKNEGGDQDLFKLVICNSYGSQEVQKLKDDDNNLKLTSQTYIGCDWEFEDKETYYDTKEADAFEEHESCNAAKEPKKAITVCGCMDLFVNTEVLGEDDAWYCPNCKEHVQASKKFDLWKMPEILVIHLKRFSYNRYFRNKIESKVEFPLQNLDLSDYVVNEEEPQPLYDLFAVSNHFGGLGGGHYTAYAKNKDNGKWYSFDDSHVSEASPESICSSSSYLLFYQRKTEGRRKTEPLNRSLSVSFDEEVKEESIKFQKKKQQQQQSKQSNLIKEEAEENEDGEGNAFSN